jgi:hypothetical protein
MAARCHRIDRAAIGSTALRSDCALRSDLTAPRRASRRASGAGHAARAPRAALAARNVRDCRRGVSPARRAHGRRATARVAAAARSAGFPFCRRPPTRCTGISSSRRTGRSSRDLSPSGPPALRPPAKGVQDSARSRRRSTRPSRPRAGSPVSSAAISSPMLTERTGRSSRPRCALRHPRPGRVLRLSRARPRPGEPGEAAPGRVDSPLIGETPRPAPERRGPA